MLVIDVVDEVFIVGWWSVLVFEDIVVRDGLRSGNKVKERYSL